MGPLRARLWDVTPWESSKSHQNLVQGLCVLGGMRLGTQILSLLLRASLHRPQLQGLVVLPLPLGPW